MSAKKSRKPRASLVRAAIALASDGYINVRLQTGLVKAARAMHAEVASDTQAVIAALQAGLDMPTVSRWLESLLRIAHSTELSEHQRGLVNTIERELLARAFKGTR